MVHTWSILDEDILEVMDISSGCYVYHIPLSFVSTKCLSFFIRLAHDTHGRKRSQSTVDYWIIPPTIILVSSDNLNQIYGTS